jgi:hypothetical protein
MQGKLCGGAQPRRTVAFARIDFGRIVGERDIVSAPILPYCGATWLRPLSWGSVRAGEIDNIVDFYRRFSIETEPYNRR